MNAHAATSRRINCIFDSRLLLHHIHAVPKTCYVNCHRLLFSQKRHFIYHHFVCAEPTPMRQHKERMFHWIARRDQSMNCTNIAWRRSLQCVECEAINGETQAPTPSSLPSAVLRLPTEKRRGECVNRRGDVVVLGRQQTNGAQCESASRTEPVEYIEGKQKYNIIFYRVWWAIAPVLVFIRLLLSDDVLSETSLNL